MNTITMHAGRAMAVAALAMMVMIAPAHAQFEETDEAESVMYLNDLTGQGITVHIEPLGKASPGMSHADAMLIVVDNAFLQEVMPGFLVLLGEELDDKALDVIGADAGKLFAVVNTNFDSSLEPALVLVLIDGDTLIMIGYLGYDEDADMVEAVLFAEDVIKDGVEADPPKGFVAID